MQYTLVTNTAEAQVDEQIIDGDRHLVARDVTFIRAMELAGGYVPREQVANSAPDWDRVPLTINHPKNLPDRPWHDPSHEGYYVSANKTDEVRRRKVVGHARNPSRPSDGSVAADLAVNVERAEAIANGEAVAEEDAKAATALLEALRNEDSFDVSSQYFPRPLPPGEYDGAQRDEVEAVANADSIALLPTKRGQCSLADGCGFNPQQAAASANAVRAPVANADAAGSDDPTGARPSGRDTLRDMRANKTVGGITYSGTATGDLDESTIPNDDYESHYVFDANTKTESSFPLVDADGNLRRGNVAAAFRFRGDAPDTGQLLEVLAAVNDEFDDPPIDAESLEEAMTGNASGPVGSILSFLGLSGNDEDEDVSSDTTTPAESGAGVGASPSASGSNPADEPGINMDRDELIDDITSNSEIKRESLEGMGDQCLQATHDSVVSNDADGGSTDPTGNGDELVERLEAIEEKMVTEDELDDVVANAQANSTKRDLATEIVANSAEYDDVEAVREDFPTEASLRAKRDQVSDTGGVAPAGGMAANASVGEDEIDTDDVSAGVFE